MGQFYDKIRLCIISRTWLSSHIDFNYDTWCCIQCSRFRINGEFVSRKYLHKVYNARSSLRTALAVRHTSRARHWLNRLSSTRFWSCGRRSLDELVVVQVSLSFMTSRLSLHHSREASTVCCAIRCLPDFDDRKKLPVPSTVTGISEERMVRIWRHVLPHDATRHETRLFTIATPLRQAQQPHYISLRHWPLSWANIIHALFFSPSSFGKIRRMWRLTGACFLLFYVFDFIIVSLRSRTAEPSFELDSQCPSRLRHAVLHV